MFWLCVLSFLHGVTTEAGFAADSLEWSVKAAYLLKLPAFIAWPNNAFESASSPFTLCVSGETPVGDLVSRAADDQRIQQRPVVVLRLKDVPPSRCQMLYLAGNGNFIAQTLGTLKGTPVLTVTDSESSPSEKGIINLVVVGNHVRFQIDRDAAALNHLQISSKLLSLAVPAADESAPP